MKRLVTGLLGVLLGVITGFSVLFAVGSGTPANIQQDRSVKISQERLAFGSIGSMGRITATVTGPGNPNVRWKIANPDIAAIDNNGVITSLNFGETLLIAQAANAADTAVVTVSQVAVNAVLDASLDSLNFNALGDTVQYQAVATDSNGFEIQNTTPVLRWFSSDTNVVTIDSVTAEAIIRGNGRANVWVELR